LAVNPPKSFVGSLPPFTVAEKRAARKRGDMLLPIKKSYALLAKYGCFARETCDKCGIVLGAVRFTRHGELEVYCARECRGDAQRSATHRRGRPRKYKTERERRTAKTRQRQVYRSHPSVEKTVRIQSETKNLQMQKMPLSYLGTPGPGKPLISSQRTYMAIAPKLALHTLPPELLEAASEWGWSTKEKWQITKIVREVLLSRGLLTI
jgi:hypothetical protein